MDQKNIGEFISAKRKEKKYTQKELADKLNISEKTISKWETGHGLPELSNMQPLCEELNITVTELLNGKEINKIKEDKIIDYIEYKEKKNKKKYIIIMGILITFLIVSILGIYFVNNYGKTIIYKLDGESENFSFHDATITISNISNILTSGKFSQNGNIENIVILETKLMYKNQLILGDSFVKGNIKLVQEQNGYYEIFNKEKLENIDDWYINILYLNEDKVYEEKIQLTATQILKNDEFIHKKSVQIGKSNRQEETDFNDDYQVSLKQREKLLSEGFNQLDEKYFVLQKKTNTEETTISLGKKRISYLRYIYKDTKGNSRYIPHLSLDNLDLISVSAKQDNKKFDYSYNNQTQKVTCNYGECPDFILEEGKEYYKRFYDLLKIEEN